MPNMGYCFGPFRGPLIETIAGPLFHCAHNPIDRMAKTQATTPEASTEADWITALFGSDDEEIDIKVEPGYDGDDEDSAAWLLYPIIRVREVRERDGGEQELVHWAPT